MIDGRLRSGVAVVVVVLAGLAGSGACSDSDSDSPPPTTTSSSTSTSPVATTVTTSSSASTSPVPPAPTSPAPTTAVADDVVVRGTVLTIFSSARLLQLDPPVDGYSRVALTSDTEYRQADGSVATLADVNEGSTVEVTGSPGAEGTLIARRVELAG